MSDTIPHASVDGPTNATQRLAESRQSFQAHLQRLREELASTNAEIASQLGKIRKGRETHPMYAEMRRYSGAGVHALFDLVEELKSDVESLMRTIPGFVSYSLFRTNEGGVAFTICDHKAGADQSARIAHEWIASNAAELGTQDPEISEGPIVVHLN